MQLVRSTLSIIIPLSFYTIFPSTGNRHTVSIDCALAMLMDPASSAPSSPGTDNPISPSPPLPVSTSGRHAVFSLSRVIATSLVDRETLSSTIAAIYDQLDLQEAVLRGYRSLKVTCQYQKSQIDRLQEELRLYVEIAPLLPAHVQGRYLSICTDHQNLIERSREFQTQLERRLSQDDVIRDLNMALLKFKADLERETDRRIVESAIAHQQVGMLTSCLAAVE